jgi:hypothetical protein
MALARRSKRLRVLVLRLPYGKTRTGMIGRFFHEIVADMGNGRFDRLMPQVHPDAEIEMFSLGTYHGREGWRTGLSDWLEAFDAPRLEMNEFIDPGGKQVLCVGTISGKVKGTEVPIERDLYFVVWVEDGMAARGRVYDGEQDALEAMGLSE